MVKKQRKAQRKRTKRMLDVKLPSLKVRASSFLSFLYRTVKRLLSGNEILSGIVLSEKRMRICERCPHRNGYWCGKCGCMFPAKTKFLAEHCPEFRW